MASVFTRIMAGDLPGRFVFADDRCAAFLTIAPITPGHTLVVPREEVDAWTDLDPDLAAHLFRVGQHVARGILVAFRPPRVGLMIAGFEVPHTHLHVLGIQHEGDLDFHRADPAVDPAVLDDTAERLRAALPEPA
jgi:histidine triad (HIT) family protein